MYSNPENIIEIPFPFLSFVQPTDRFNLDAGGNFAYMGREGFSRVLKFFDNSRRYRWLRIYGSIGYGKSHILAAMACYLFQQGKRVVYLPDCRPMVKDFLEYLRCGLLLAFGDSESHQIEIVKCLSVDAIRSFCKTITYYGIHLYFIVDQLNALDEEGTNKDDLPNSKKIEISSDLDKITSGHFVIKSASANYKAAMYMSYKQMSEMKISFFGGLTKVWKFLC